MRFRERMESGKAARRDVLDSSPRDLKDREHSTKPDAVTQKGSSLRIPLTVLPQGAVYSFPFVLGLDTYSYEFGQNMAARASTRWERAKGDSAQGAKAKGRTHRNISTMVQAGLTGSTAILCHGGVHSSDSGLGQIRKRRQKLTDDLLHDLVVSHGDPVDKVHQWFQIFLHYSDPPEDIVLPSLPEKRNEEAAILDEKVVTSRTASRISTKSGARKSKLLQRPCSAPSLKRPEIVRVPRRRCKDDDFEDRYELQKTRNLLKEAGLAGPGAGQLDLVHRLRVQNLNDEAFSEWLESFTFIWNLQRLPTEALQQLQRSKSSPVPRPPSRRSKRERDVTTRYIRKLDAKVAGLGLGEGEFVDTVFDGSATSSATVETEVTEGAEEGPMTLQDLSLHQIMLQSSSLAMMNCGIVRTAKGRDLGNRQGSKAAFDEILRSRAEILNSVAPIQMTLNNFTAFIALLGVHRRETIERVAKHLFLSVPRASRSKQSILDPEHEDDKDDHWQDSTTLPFEAFYRFVRALRVHPLGSTDANHPYVFSDLLCRLLFCALTGHEGVSHMASAAMTFKDDATVKPLTLQSFIQSLKLFVSEEPLREAAEERLEYRLSDFAEFVFSALLRSQAGCLVLFALGCRETCGVSFNGFQNFVRQKPQVYLQLIFLLLPLAMRGEEFAAEEMHLMQKGLYHRAGELREKVR
eukprot:Skav234432  [mRNA]  locus=scaffold3409:40549:44116:+ [translate_table: standard]